MLILGLRHLADIRTLAFIALLSALYLLQWTGVYRHSLVLAASYVLCFVACIAKHNHMHCPTFRGGVSSSGFGVWLTLLTGQPSTGIITAHNVLHHGSNNTARDYVRCSLVRFRWNWLNLLLFPFVSVWIMLSDKPSDLKRWQARRPGLYRQALLERTLLYGFIAALLWLDWRAALVYVGGPWLFAQWALVAINLLQHQDCDPGSDFDHSRDVTGRWMNWLFLNNGFHTAHHLRPALHWSQLPAYHEREVAPHMKPGLNQVSLAAALWQQFFQARA